MSLREKIQSFINNLNGDAQIKRQRDNFIELDEDDALVIGSSQYGDIGFDKKKLLSDTRCLIVGTSGSGKSYFTRNIIESIYNASFTDDDGRPIQEKVIQIHDPEGEYYTLRDHNGQFDFVILGRGDDVDVQITDENAAELALKCLVNKINCIIDYTAIPDQDEKLKIAIAWNQTLIEADKKYRTCLFLFVDEAHRFAQRANTNPLNVQSKSWLKLIAQLGRKRGIVSFFITQRVTHLHNDITAECNNFLIGKTNIDTDVRRNGELTRIASPKQQAIFKTLRKEFVVSGESFCHSDDDFLSSEIVRCTSNSPISKHGKKNINFNDPLYYEPRPKVKHWINILNNNIDIAKEKEDKDISSENPQKIKSVVEKSLNNEFNTAKNAETLANNIFETWFHIICHFEHISIKNLYVLTGRDDYNPISSGMEIKLFLKQYPRLFSENGEAVWWNPKSELDENEKSKTEIAKADYFINLWKFKLNDMIHERILLYLFKDENNENMIEEICEGANVNQKELMDFVVKYERCGLVKQIEDCVYLNTIFFDRKIHDNIPVFADRPGSDDPSDEIFDESDEFDDDFEEEGMDD